TTCACEGEPTRYRFPPIVLAMAISLNFPSSSYNECNVIVEVDWPAAISTCPALLKSPITTQSPSRAALPVIIRLTAILRDGGGETVSIIVASSPSFVVVAGETETLTDCCAHE